MAAPTVVTGVCGIAHRAVLALVAHRRPASRLWCSLGPGPQPGVHAAPVLRNHSCKLHGWNTVAPRRTVGTACDRVRSSHLHFHSAAPCALSWFRPSFRTPRCFGLASPHPRTSVDSRQPRRRRYFDLSGPAKNEHSYLSCGITGYFLRRRAWLPALRGSRDHGTTRRKPGVHKYRL